MFPSAGGLPAVDAFSARMAGPGDHSAQKNVRGFVRLAGANSPAKGSLVHFRGRGVRLARGGASPTS